MANALKRAVSSGDLRTDNKKRRILLTRALTRQPPPLPAGAPATEAQVAERRKLQKRRSEVNVQEELGRVISDSKLLLAELGFHKTSFTDKDSWPESLKELVRAGHSWTKMNRQELSDMREALFQLRDGNGGTSRPLSSGFSGAALSLLALAFNTDNPNVVSVALWRSGGCAGAEGPPTISFAVISADHAMQHRPHEIFPGFDGTTIVSVSHEGDLLVAEVLLWLGSRAVVVTGESPQVLQNPQHLLVELQRTNKLFPSSVDGGIEIASIRALFARVGVLKDPLLVMRASSLVLAVQSLLTLSGHRSPRAGAADDCYAPLIPLFQGVQEGPQTGQLRGCMVSWAASVRGGSKAWKLPSPLDPARALSSLADCESLNTALDWLCHFNVSPFAPSSFAHPDIVGKLIIWSTMRDEELVWDCSLIYRFDWSKKQATLRMVYSPYTVLDVVLQVTEENFVTDLADAAPDGVRDLPWMFAQYPRRPCDEFPPRPVPVHGSCGQRAADVRNEEQQR